LATSGAKNLAIDNRDAAGVVASYPEQGWSLLCNRIVVFSRA